MRRELEHRLRVPSDGPHFAKAEKTFIDQCDNGRDVRYWRYTLKGKAGFGFHKLCISTANMPAVGAHQRFDFPVVKPPIAGCDNQHDGIIGLAAKDSASGNLTGINSKGLCYLLR